LRFSNQTDQAGTALQFLLRELPEVMVVGVPLTIVV
jgi:hypothetical protein